MVVSMFQEKRNAVRVRSIHLLTFETMGRAEAGQDLGMARTLNISEEGILIEAYKEVHEGAELEILLTLADHCITTRGRVVRIKPARACWKVALEFTEVSPEDRVILDSFLDNNFPYTRYSL
ncbi:PilZ domain-containing protein [bacterium]|nr:PilZ domain-containing protein [bacterium]